MPDSLHGHLRHLANFAHVVDAGSITSAANRLGTSPSSLSDSVKLLEAHLGEPLIERRRSGVVPTGRGHAIYAEAQQIVAALDRALGAKTEAAQATLRVSLPAELAAGWFDDALARIARDLPEVSLVLLVEDALVDHTKYARDLHVRAGSSALKPGLTELAKGAARAVMVAPVEILDGLDPNDPAAVSRLPFIGKPRPGPEAELKLRNGRITFTRVLQVSSVTTRIAMARAGLGVVTCLDRSVADHIAAGRLVRLLPQFFDFPVHVSIASPHKRPPRAARAVAEQFGNSLSRHPGLATEGAEV